MRPSMWQNLPEETAWLLPQPKKKPRLHRAGKSFMGNSGLAVSKVIAKVAGVGLDPDCIAFLHDCFRQFNVHVVAMNGNPVELFHKQKFEACVLRLYDPDVEEILSTVRGSASNRRMVIYGIARNTQE